jgi:hypothetical protein
MFFNVFVPNGAAWTVLIRTLCKAGELLAPFPNELVKLE